MNSYMTIMVRVVSNRAQAQLAALRAQQAGLNSGIAQNARLAPLGTQHIRGLMKLGNQLQWTGRMLQYNFTLPILAAGVAAGTWSMQQEKAMTHVRKVYGDTEDAAKQFRKEMDLGRKAAMDLAESYRTDELEALDKAFTAISNHYGVQKKEVLEVAGAWAAAGASGLDLAESVNATMKAIIIGDMEAAQATKALISVQAQYNLSTKELNATLATLNSIENATGASMSDLIIGFEKAAGVARSAGVETGQLAAYMAALVPATGSAATAGNALKTIMSRLVAPTKETVQVLDHLGFSVQSAGWQSATVTEKLALLAEQFDGMGQASKNAAASVIASRWQVNRFDILMKEIVSDTGYYAKALESASNQGESFTRMQRELNEVLESDPRRLQRMWVMLQNAMVEIIQPAIPFILYLADSVADLANAFANLDPNIQKIVLLLLVLLAAIGPIVKYLGALKTLAGTVALGFVYAAKGAWLFIGSLTAMLTPFRMLGTIAMGTLGVISAGIVKFFTLLLAGTAFTFARTVAITTAGWAAKLNAFRIWAALQLTLLRGFWGRFLTLWATATVLAGTRWGAFWALMSVFTSRGMAAIGARIVAGGGIILAIVTLGGAVAKAWMVAMRTLVLVTSGAAVMMVRIWGASAAAGVGIWTRLKSTVVVLHAGMWALVVATSRAMWTTMLAMWALGGKKLLVIVRAMFLRIIPFIFGPWGLAVAAVVGLLYTFREQIAQIWNNIVQFFAGSGGDVTDIFTSMSNGILRAFYALPQGVQDVMIAIVTIVRDAALAVYDWFQYINPWAQHSPSLVQNVTSGIEEVNKQFSKLSNIKKYTTAAYAEIKRFGQLTAQLGLSAAAVQARADRATLKKAGAGAALGSYNKLMGLLNKLNPILKTLEGRMNTQQRVVDLWQAKVDKANRALDRQQSVLDDLQGTLDKYQSKLQAAQDSLDFYASAPLEGMRAMEDQIFRNQMAQTRLRLEMIKFEDVNGTFDELRSKIEAINGAQEILRGTQQSLRQGGAGSDILSGYDDEIKKLDEQKDKYKAAANTLADMQARLDKLQRQAEKLDLIKAMKFDELQYQIDRAANRMKEMPFDEIMAGIRDANAQIDKYGPKVDAASAAVDRQQAVVDKLTAARDRLQSRLDREQEILDRIKTKYDEVNEAIQAINSAISDVVSNATKMNDALDKKSKKGAGAKPYISPGLQNLMDAKDFTYPDPGGKGIPPRTDWSNQSDLIDKFTSDMAADTAAAFEDLNPFKPLMNKAKEWWSWLKNQAVEVWGGVVDFFGAAFKGVDFGGADMGGIWDGLKKTGEFITEVLRDVAAFGKKIWELIGPDVIQAGNEIWKSLKRAWDELAPLFASFADLIEPVGKAIKNLWTILKPVLMLIAGPLLLGMKVGFAILAETVGPVIDMIADIIKGLVMVIKGSIQVVAGVLTGDLSMILDGVENLFKGTFGQIWAIIKGAVRIIWNVVEGLVEGIWDFFTWLYDELVGHSIIPDLIDGIVWWFKSLVNVAKWLWSNFVKPIINIFVWVFTKVIALAKAWWTGWMLVWAVLKTIGVWFWNNVLKPIWNEAVKLWPLVKAAFSMWWEGVKIAWAGLVNAAGWIWNNVLQPVWRSFKRTWDNLIWPFLKKWWAGIKRAWNTLKRVGSWVWENVLQPVWNKIVDLWKKIRPELAKWWDRIKQAWNNLKATARWIWENVLKPIWNKLVDLWNKIRPELQSWWDRIKRVWNKLTTIGTWIKENVMDPVFTAIKNGWTRVKEWLVDSKNFLLEPVKGIMGSVRTVMNTVIGGLNKVSDMLPGIDFHVALIPEFASGTHGLPTKRVGSGFMTHGARAIVGEGKPNYPEFVIPTDPTHRNRAKSLLAMAAAKVGGGALETVMNAGRSGGIPQYGLGGWLDDRYDDVKDMADKLKDELADLGKNAIGKIMNPLLDVAESKIKDTNWGPIESAGLYVTNKIQDWTSSSDQNLNDFVTAAKKAQNSGAGSVPVEIPSNPGSRSIWKGGTFTNLFIAHMKKAEEIGHGQIYVTQGGFRPRTSYSGTSHQGDALDMQVNYALGKALRRVGIASGDRTGLGDWGAHIHAVPGPKAGHAAGSAPWQFQDYLARGGRKQSMRSPWGLASGGIAKARRGGVWANLAEAGQDEAVIPLPNDWERGLFAPKGGDTLNFYGDLTFPNIKNGNDAKSFIENLKQLAED